MDSSIYMNGSTSTFAADGYSSFNNRSRRHLPYVPYKTHASRTDATRDHGYPRLPLTAGGHVSHLPTKTNHNSKKKWMVQLCQEPSGDAETCCLGCFCPQFLYGRTQFRLKQMADDKDPFDLSDFRWFNGPCTCCTVVACFTGMSCALVMLQHSRLRAMYTIEGHQMCDCCQATYCIRCTLMQDEREVCARERLCRRLKKEKAQGTVDQQPSNEPDMQYPAVSHTQEPGSQVSLRQSLVKKSAKPEGEELEVTSASSRNETAHDSSKGQSGHQEARNSQEIELSEVRRHGKGQQSTPDSYVPSGSQLPSFARCVQQVRDDTRVFLECRRGPTRAGSPDEFQSVSLAECRSCISQSERQDENEPIGLVRLHPGQTQARNQHTDTQDSLDIFLGESGKFSENQDPSIARHIESNRSGVDATRQAKGKQVLDNFKSGDCLRPEGQNVDGLEHIEDFSADPGRRKTEGTISSILEQNTSKVSPADEAVLVYYNDTDRPQRHRLADCARLRPSTPGRPDTPHFSHSPSDCATEDITSDNEGSEVQVSDDGRAKWARNFGKQPHVLEDCFVNKVDTTEGVTYDEDLRHSIKGCTVDDSRSSGDAVPEEALQHSLSDCAAEASSVIEEINANGPFQHSLVDCAIVSSSFEVTKHQSTHTHSPEDCAGDGSIAPGDMGEKVEGHTELLLQHSLIDCAIETISASTEPEVSPQVSLHRLAECIQIDSEEDPKESKTPEQHGMADCAIVEQVDPESEPTGSTSLEEHDIAHCPSIEEPSTPEESLIEYPASTCTNDSTHTTPNSKHNPTTLIVVPPPLIIVTNSDLASDLSIEQHSLIKSKSASILFTSSSTARPRTTRSTTELGLVDCDVVEKNDGAADLKKLERQRELSIAARSLRKVLDVERIAGVGAGNLGMELERGRPVKGRKEQRSAGSV